MLLSCNCPWKKKKGIELKLNCKGSGGETGVLETPEKRELAPKNQTEKPALGTKTKLGDQLQPQWSFGGVNKNKEKGKNHMEDWGKGSRNPD